MKKILFSLLAIALVLSLAATSVAAYDLKQSFINDETYVMGDSNGDGGVDGKDALALKATVAGMGGYDPDPEATDFDADGDLSAKDSYSMKLVLSGNKTSADFEKKNGEHVQLYKLTVGGYDISEFSILLGENITEYDNSYVSATLLRNYIKKITGEELPIAYGTAATDHVIRFVQYDMFSEEGQKYGLEGLRYEVKDGDLNIYGTLRGTMYAVYEILENYLGVRFFSNSETYVYKARLVDIPEGTEAEIHPTVTFRHAGQTFGSSGALNYYLALKLNGDYLGGFDEKRFGTLTGPIYSNAHSFNEYWKMGTGTYPENTEGMTESQILEAKFASGTAPDPYGWQPCVTNEKDYKTLFTGMLECNRMGMLWGNTPFIEEGATVFSFSICDNQNYCTCRNCRKIAVTQKEGYSGLYLSLYNRACVDVQEYYPGVRLMGIVYAKDFPKTIKPDENLIILYCGTGCNNHMLGREDCYEKGGQLNNSNNNNDVFALNYWGDACEETGAELWFWVYPVTYHYYLVGCPNIPNLYYDTKYLIDECNVTGFYYEGGGRTYNFEALKAHVSAHLMWDTDMTYDEFVEVCKEYLYMSYGDGYEEIWEYIEMQTEAGDQCGTCFINNFDRPGDMYSYEYLAENYEYMRALLVTAYEKAERSAHKSKIETLIMSCDFMGLSSVHTDWYVNKNNVELYKERYANMYNYIVNNNIVTFSESGVYPVPESLDYETNPMTQFYVNGSRRPNVYP